MSKEFDQDNIMSALKGEAIIRACVSCKHYNGAWFSDATCNRQLELKYHPITGKKKWMGDVFSCQQERCMEGTSHSSRPSEPCGPSGRYWKKKEPRFIRRG